MAREIELKLRFARKDLPRLLAHPLLKQSARVQHLYNTYYDSDELALHQRHVAVRLRRKNAATLLTVKSSAPASGGLSMRQEWEEEATPGMFDFSLVSDPPLRQFLERLRPALRPVFSTDFERRTWILSEGEARIEVAIDLGRISVGKFGDRHGEKGGEKREEKICEIELELLSGDMAHLFTLCRALQRKVVLIPALPSKAERGYRCFLGTPPAPVFAPPPALAANGTPTQALRQLLLAQIEHLQHNEGGLLERQNPEYIHQARLALRRLRSALAFFAPLLPADYAARFASRWQKLARLLGSTRDWDVFLHDTLAPMRHAFPEQDSLRALHKLARHEAAAGRKIIRQYGNSDAHGRLLIDFTAATYALALPSDTDLRRFSKARWQEWRSETQALAARTPADRPAALHRLRRRLKAVQFTADLLREHAPELAAIPGMAHLKGLLKELGQYNDLAVAQQLLRARHVTANLAHAWIAGQRALLQQQIPALLKRWSEAG